MPKKRYHLWDSLEIGESVTVALPVRDLVHVQERFSRERNKVFALREIDTPPTDYSGAQSTIVTRMM